MKYCTLLIAAIFCYQSMQAGGPWPQPKGKAFVKLSEWWVVYDQHYTSAGEVEPNVTTGIFNTTLYSEYGLTNKLNVLLNATVFSRNYMKDLVSDTSNMVPADGESINALGDIDIGLKYGLTKKNAKIPVVVTLYLGLPTGKTKGGTQKNLQTGDGEFNQWLQVEAGKSFFISEKITAYSSGGLGINFRSNDFSDELRFNLEFGMGFADNKLWIISRINGVESLRNGTGNETVSNSGLFANNTEYIGIGLETSYYFTKHLGASFELAGAFRAESTAAAPSFSIGIFYNMNK